ncbi:MAG: hypothetical protein A2487_14845 [Candidatus Raymondbacteria bacterium RifOxyC12_full_50_8]|nr:MAG: hypothetical protein A2487_14845 [Candidatus Raymondbacteria bacterium RifOxyC12_full_50_8]
MKYVCFFLMVLLVLCHVSYAKIRNPWILVDHSLNTWSSIKSTTTHDHFPSFPEYDSTNPDAFFKAWHDSICAGEHRCGGDVYDDWGGDCNYARKNEIFFHNGDTYLEFPIQSDGYAMCVSDPVKLFNVFGFGFCAPTSANEVNYYQLLGHEGRKLSLPGHHVCDTYYNGGWHYFDWDEGGWGANSLGVTYGLDSATIFGANWDQVPVKSDYFWSYGGDLTFIKGALPYPQALFFGSDVNTGGGADMSFCLHIGEKIERFYNPINTNYRIRLSGITSYSVPVWGNSRITYDPVLGSGYADYEDGIYDEENTVLEPDGVRLTDGYVIWAIRSPYPMFDSDVSLDTTGNLTVELSFDLGNTWAAYTEQTYSPSYRYAALNQTEGQYDYLLRVAGNGKITGLKVVTIGQLNPGGLPLLRAGDNNVRFLLYDNDETLSLLPDWSTVDGYNKYVVNAAGYTWSNGRVTGDSGSYITLKLDGPRNSDVVSVSGYFPVTRNKRFSEFVPSPTNTFHIKTGNSSTNLALRTTAPSPMHTTPEFMARTDRGGFAGSQQPVSFERDSISDPGTDGYVQFYSTGQNSSVNAPRLYMHYHANHLQEDYLNDIKITHIFKTINGNGRDTVINKFTADDIFQANGLIDYTVTCANAWVKDPSFCNIMEVEGGVTFDHLHNNPVINTAVRDNAMLENNVPNPFALTTNIRFSIQCDVKQNVRLAVYNPNGVMVKMLKNGFLNTGKYAVDWDGFDARGMKAPNGIYLCRLWAGNKVQTKKITMLR